MPNKNTGLFLIGSSILVLAIVLMLGHIASSIKEAAWFAKNGGSIHFATAVYETPFMIYIMIFIVIILGLYAIIRKK